MNNQSAKIRDRKPLLAQISSFAAEISNYGNFQDRFSDKLIQRISIEQWIDLYDHHPDLVTLDVRSEQEFSIDHLPNAINFPILNNQERDEVGFLYKQVSPTAAYFWAERIADTKKHEINLLADKLRGKNVALYCWRGGGRSTAMAHFLNQAGLVCPKISGGYKSYRNRVHHTFYQAGADKLNFMVLTGLTGCGKTEIIERLTSKIPCLDIESAASHASSLFGQLRYSDQNNVATQTEFESRLFVQLLNHHNRPELPYLTEGESKSVSSFQIPDALYKRLKSSPAVRVEASLETRIERIEREYLSGDKIIGIDKILNSSKFFKMLLGTAKIKWLSSLLENGRTEEFCEWFLLEYYDKRYAGSYSNIIATIDSNNIGQAAQEIMELLNNNAV